MQRAWGGSASWPLDVVRGLKAAAYKNNDTSNGEGEGNGFFPMAKGPFCKASHLRTYFQST